MRRQFSCRICPSLAVLGLLLTVSSPVDGQPLSGSASNTFYVAADAGPTGDGSRRNPFVSLSQAEATGMESPSISAGVCWAAAATTDSSTTRRAGCGCLRTG